MEMHNTVRVIVIGAGCSGIIAAKTYLQVASFARAGSRRVDLTVLDENESVGGVWAKSRLYPGLVANAPRGLYEYSDLVMVDDGHSNQSLIPGAQVQQYLEHYAKKFGVYDKIRFNTKVASIVRQSQRGTPGWKLTSTTGEAFHCEKLIVASGLFSKPRLPKIPTSDYSGLSIHSRDLGLHASRIASDTSIEDVVVVGAAKSALDTVNLCLEHGKRVSWLVRPNEKGVPIAVVDPEAKPNLLGIYTARLFAICSPSPWLTSGFWYRFLHSGLWLLGTLIMKLYWSGMTLALKWEMQYQKSQNGRKIEPVGKTFSHDTTFISIMLKKSPFMKALHADDPNRLLVYRATPMSLRNHTLRISNSVRDSTVMQDLKADAVVWCTGWESTLGFLQDSEVMGSSLIVGDAQKVDQHDRWHGLDTASLRQMEQVFPWLKLNLARLPSEPINSLPIRLYRHAMPFDCLPDEGDKGNIDRSIAFTAFTASSQTTVTFEILALWTVAWLEGLMPQRSIPTRFEAMQSIAELQAFRTLRYGEQSKGQLDCVMEIQGLHDQLLQDLGLDPERKRRRILRAKGNGLLARLEAVVREWIQPYRPSDYSGIVEEFLTAIDSSNHDQPG